MSYEPPDGMPHFVSVLQRASPEDAADLLRLAFENAGATALVDDLQIRRSAPVLLAACKLALHAAIDKQEINPFVLADAIAEAERAR